MSYLNALFNPRTIAVVGVSENSAKLGSVIFNNIINSGFLGKAFPVNPKYKELYGYKAYKSILDIRENLDLVVIVIPGDVVEGIIKECVKKKVKSVIIISAGFKEIGKKGEELENRIKLIVHKSELKLLGPNCLGVINPLNKLNASFAALNATPGNVAFASQSGALCTMILDLAAEKNLGFANFVSLGNKADINELELLEYWEKNKNVKVIGLYLEEIENGDMFYRLLERSKKPIIILAPGKSEEAKKAINSHTGSLASSASTINTVTKQAGAISVDTIEELFNDMMALSWSHLPKGNKVAILTNAGGPGVLATDLVIENGLELSELSDKSKKILEKFLPKETSIKNPIDVLGTALAASYKLPLEVLIKDENVDGIIVIVTPQLITQIEETAKIIVNASAISNKPIFTAFLGGKYAQTGLQRLYDNKLPGFKYLGDAIKTMSHLYQYTLSRTKDRYDNLKRIRSLKGKYINKIKPYLSKIEVALPTKLVDKMAKEANIDLPNQQVVYDEDDCLSFIYKYGFPVVLKAEAQDIVHKTEFKGLYLHINDEKSLLNKFNKLIKNIQKHTIRKEIGCLIQEQINEGEEIIIGLHRDGNSKVYENNMPGFGHMLLFGKGGIFTELYKDISTRLIPINKEEIKKMISETKIYQILLGYRGSKNLGIDKLIDTIYSLQELALKYPEISSLDINPAFLTKDRCIAVDIKAFVKE